MNTSPPDLKPALLALSEGQDLTPEITEAAFQAIMSGAVPDIEIAALLMGLRVKGETAQEISAAARGMCSHMTRLRAPVGAIDIVGTGGDGAQTFNISTAATFVVAGCGVPVAKHGNKAVTSGSGASDILTALGVQVMCPPEVAQHALDEIGVCFMMAPVYHPAMRHVMPVRLGLGIKTLFNILGPICNPAGVKRAVLGVFSPDLTELYAHAIQDLGIESALIVHGAGGLDELSTLGPTSRVTRLEAGKISTSEWHLESFGLKIAQLDDLQGSDAVENAKTMQRLLQGEEGPLRDIVLYNAAAALMVAGHVDSIATGLQTAAASIDTGAARTKLDQLIEITNSSSNTFSGATAATS